MNADDNKAGLDSLSGLADLAGFFAPSWAKDDAAETVRVVEGDGARRRRDDRLPRPAPQRRDGARPPRPADGKGAEHGRDGRPGRDWSDNPHHGDGRQRRGGDRPHDMRRERHAAPPPPPPLDFAVRFLPEGKALDSIIRRIQTTRRAYPFREIVKLFQKDDASLAVRIEANKAADPAARIWQCRACSLPALDAAELEAHILEKHLCDHFEERVVEGDPPAGNFPCVARCGLTGELLGPPNHHSYQARIQQMLRERFPGMSDSEYRTHIEMVRDPEAIEQWRENAKKQTLYFRKAEPAAASADRPDTQEGQDTPENPPEAPAKGLTRQEAESIFRSEILPSLMNSASHVVCQAKSLKNMPNRRLASFLSGEFAKDEDLRSQGSLSRAVHAAFHHRGLKFFRAMDDRGQEFVTAIAPVKFEAENTTAEIAALISYTSDNPCCQVKTMVEELAGDGGDEAVKRMTASLRWLIERGHIVEFYNGALSIAAAHPQFWATPPKKKAKAEKPRPTEEAQKPDAKADDAHDAAAQPAEPAEAAPEAPAPAETSCATPAEIAPEAPAPVEATAVAEAPATNEAQETPAPVEDAPAEQAPSQTEDKA